MAALAEVRDLVKTFGKTRAIDGVTAVVDQGPPVGLVGPNGAGKTTLFSLLCGFLRPTAGRVTVFGHRPLHQNLRGRVAVLPQDASLIKGMPVVSQLRLFAALHGFAAGDAAREADKALAITGLTERAHEPPEAFSHGMLKRAAIAQTFIGQPELILLDEPTAGLDPATAKSIHALIRKTTGDRTYIISSHNLEEIEDLCRTVIILNKGRISVHGEIADLVGRATCLTFRLEAAPPERVQSLFDQVEGVIRVETGAPGEHVLTVHYRAEGDQATQRLILDTLDRAGIGFREMKRGQSLAGHVLRMTS